MKKIIIILLISLLISCGSSNENDKKTINDNPNTVLVDSEKKWEEFTVGAVGNTMSDMKFDVKNITVKEGSWVRIKLVNEGVDPAMLHNIVFINYGTRKEVAMQSIDAGPDKKYVPDNSNVIAFSDLANPGETVILEFKAPDRGNYEFLCTYPGHSEIMRGYFFVK
tara:strand:- start:2678 stop:3175 length:498 start_codon:yes stop_codon:yes gene_type:complete